MEDKLVLFLWSHYIAEQRRYKQMEKKSEGVWESFCRHWEESAFLRSAGSCPFPDLPNRPILFQFGVLKLPGYNPNLWMTDNLAYTIMPIFRSQKLRKVSLTPQWLRRLFSTTCQEHRDVWLHDLQPGVQLVEGLVHLAATRSALVESRPMSCEPEIARRPIAKTKSSTTNHAVKLKAHHFVSSRGGSLANGTLNDTGCM